MNKSELSDQEIIAEAEALLSKWRFYRWVIFIFGILFMLSIIANTFGYGVPYLSEMPKGLYGAIFGYSAGFCHMYVFKNWHGPKALRLLNELLSQRNLSANGT